MKLLLQFLLATLVATVLAAPLTSQQPFTEKHDHVVKNPYIQRTNFKTPFVVKAFTTPQSAKGKPATKPIHMAKPPQKGSKSTSWLDKWRTGGDDTKIQGQSCFCAGGSVCCNTIQGMNCNYGVCGI